MLVYDIAVYSGANHSGDYLPVLKLFGKKYVKEVKAIGKAADEILQRLHDESIKEKLKSTENKPNPLFQAESSQAKPMDRDVKPNKIQITFEPTKPSQQQSSSHTNDKRKEAADNNAVAKGKRVSCAFVPEIKTNNKFDALSSLSDDDICQEH